MKLLALIYLISFFCLKINAPVFLTSFSCLLISPIILFLIKTQNSFLNVIVTLLSLTICYLIFGARKKIDKTILLNEFAPLIVFTLFFTTAYSLSLLWPNFIALGERLRDYAVLSSMNNHPFASFEPWMSKSSLNYYLYWYRFSSFYGSALLYPIWEQYHLMAAFALSFYGVSLFYLLRKFVFNSYLFAFISSVTIAFGSNLAGIRFSFFRPANSTWWYPSRVIKGAINEFPVWSFLLGDIHPHYLNLGLSLFLLSILCLILTSTEAIINKLLLIIFFTLFSFFLTFYTNAWELPLYAIAIGVTTILHFIYKKYSTEIQDSVKSKRVLVILPILLLLSYSCYLSTRNILSSGYQFSLVKNQVLGSLPSEFLYHWALPLFFILIYQLSLIKNPLIIPPVLTLLFGTLCLSEIKYFLMSLLLITIFNLVSKRKEFSKYNFLFSSLTLSSLILLLIPEIIFLDDPYGGENERMNTIFKVYSFSWGIVWISACIAIKKFFEKIQLKPLKIIFILFISSGILSELNFFRKTIYERMDSKELRVDSRGLAVVEKNFPGSSALISYLEKIPGDFVIMEASNGAYDYTSFISTLSGKLSYLGWQNHIDLLTKQYAETNRRKTLIDKVYSTTDCQERLKIIQDEKIDFVVIGNLEGNKYGDNAKINWECFHEDFSVGEYKLYK